MELVTCSAEVRLWFKFLSLKPGFMVQFKDNNVVKVDHPSPGIALVRVPGRFWYSSLTDMFQLDIFAFGPREDDPTLPAPVRKSHTPAHHT